MLGQYVNNYEIIGLLGEGGMGAVYAAQHRLIGRKVAIKILKRDLATEPEVVQRFFNEARAIGAIRHPNIIEIIDVGKLGDVPYLVMELLHGESLAERFARVGTLAFDVAVDVVSQATRALQVAHERGVVHRDLKPENLFIVTGEGPRERIKVLDFGIAKLRDDLTATPVRTRAGSLLGTPLYMSPEQCRGLDELDQRTDVYSLGVILYEALCGTPPFLAKSIGEVMRMHMFDAPEPLSHKRSGVPAQLERVIARCLEKHPEQRFADMLQLQAALELSGLATTEPDTPVPSLRVSGYEQTSQPLAPSSLAPFAIDSAPRELRQTPRSLPLGTRRAHATRSLHIALWALVLSLVAFGVPDQRVPRSSVRPAPRMAAELLQLPAAVVVASLRSFERTGQPRDAERQDTRTRAVPGDALEAKPRLGAARTTQASGARAGHEDRDSEAPERALDAAPPPGVARMHASGARDGHERRDPQAPVRAVDGRRSAPRAQAATAPTANAEGLQAQRSAAGGTAAASGGVQRAGGPTDAAAHGGAVESALQPGYLSLDCAPWAEVFLGQDALGTTPLIRVPLPPGRHQLTLRNTELDASTTYVVEIKSGQSLARLVGWGR